MFRLTLLALALVLAGTLPAFASDAPTHLNDGWSVRFGDSPIGADGVPEWARDEGDAGWTAAGKTQFDSDERFAWLRLRLPEGSWRDPALRIEGISDAGQVWFGGEKLREIGELNANGHEHIGGYGLSFVSLPDGAPGKMLYLRIQSSNGRIGIQTRPILGNRSDLVQGAWTKGFGQAMVGSLLAVLGLFALGLFLTRRSEKPLAFFAAFAIGVGTMLVVLSQYLSLLGVEPRLLMGLVYGCASVLGPGLLAFVRSSFPNAGGAWLTWLSRLLWVCAAFVTAIPLVNVEHAGSVLNPLLFTVTVGLGTAVVLLVRLSLRGGTDARLLLGGVLVLFLVNLHDVASSLRMTQELQIWTHFGVMALGLSMGALLVRRFVSLASETEERARALELQRGEALASSERMRHGAQALAEAVSRLTGATREQNGAVERQATTIEETRVTAEEIRQTSMLASERAQSLLGKVAEADEAGKRGEASLHASVAEVEQIGGEVGEMARKTSQLEHRTREIATIVETVKGLADQSNMLALNAAIEAVRSGEHGKGFAVVAREVRSLADQSIRATGRIRDILGGLEEGIREVTALSGRGEERVQRSVGQVRATAEELRRVSELSRETSGAIRQISAAVAQQNAGISQIFTAVNDLADQMRGTVSRLQETESAIAAVDAVSGSLASEGAKAA